MKSKSLKLHIIAGPNGAGKTTFAREFLPFYADCREFVNANLIAQGLSPFDPQAASIRAGRLMLERISELSTRRLTFGFETTLAGKTYLNLITRLKNEGYIVNLYFLWLQSVDTAISRVAERVSLGGHNIPEDIIRRRYKVGISNFFSFYQSIVDNWMLFDGSSGAFISIAERVNEVTLVRDGITYSQMMKGVNTVFPYGDGGVLEKTDMELAIKAAKSAFHKLIEERRHNKGSIIVWREGKVQKIPADEVAGSKIEEKD
jgi:predicted ABC-type ATPase